MARSKRPATPVGGGRAPAQRRRVAPSPPHETACPGIAPSEAARDYKDGMRLAAQVGLAAAARAAVSRGTSAGSSGPSLPPPAANVASAGSSSAGAGAAGGAASSIRPGPGASRRSSARRKGKQVKATAARAGSPNAGPATPAVVVVPMMSDTPPAVSASTLTTERSGSTASRSAPSVEGGVLHAQVPAGRVISPAAGVGEVGEPASPPQVVPNDIETAAGSPSRASASLLVAPADATTSPAPLAPSGGPARPTVPTAAGVAAGAPSSLASAAAANSTAGATYTTRGADMLA